MRPNDNLFNSFFNFFKIEEIPGTSKRLHNLTVVELCNVFGSVRIIDRCEENICFKLFVVIARDPPRRAGRDPAYFLCRQRK